ncbi:MAG TPA: glycosyl hydrolase, partial [Trebonia sp.]
MRTPAAGDPDLSVIVAACHGDRGALDALVAGYLPLVYNIVGRAMNGHPDVDEVVQETMLRAVRGIGELRDPAAFRSWLVAIAVRQARDSYRDRLALLAGLPLLAVPAGLAGRALGQVPAGLFGWPASPAPLALHTAKLKQPKPPATTPARKPAPVPPPATVTSQRKGVSTWSFTGADQALAASGASWYYNWGATPGGITAPGASYVPMIWGAANVTSATLSQVSQANMTVAQALALWPKLMATGMTLGSPAVSSGAATPGGWLDQFMAGAKARGYRVNFVTVHWYGGDFAAGPAVQELQSYLEAIYARYHRPIWLTEFALTSYSGGTATFPT